jgi:hypothetical protein
MSRIIYCGQSERSVPENEWHELYAGLKGWGNIIRSLIDDLFSLGWDGQIFQIKEKFGGLRFYIGSGTKEMHDRIVQAEREAYRTCIECGEPGTQTNAGWVLTLCPTHMPNSRRSFELLDSDSDSDSSAV